MERDLSQYDIAILVPCYNEGVTIAKVVKDFKAVIPNATVYVYDNNSSDDTSEQALKAGAVVRKEYLQGKGNVVRRMFADIDADIYVMVDGDATYHAPSAMPMINRLLDENIDMLVGCRKDSCAEVYRTGHRLGNMMFTKTVAFLFGQTFSDILSGYRIFTRRFVKSFPSISKRFEIETELTVHSLQMRIRAGEFDTPYYSRPEGSESKLNTYRDGWHILKVIIDLVLSERPLLIFGALAGGSALVTLVMFIPILIDYFISGEVPRFPTLIVATGFGLFSVVSLFFGYLFDRISQDRREVKRLFYVQL